MLPGGPHTSPVPTSKFVRRTDSTWGHDKALVGFLRDAGPRSDSIRALSVALNSLLHSGAVAPTPFQPIPETTQVHVDRLVGSQVGELDIGARVAEGRFGTIYRARRRASGTDATLEVLRTGLQGDDAEVRAVNAIKCPGVADVVDFGELPDGRRFRVLELLQGESLEQRLMQQRVFSPSEVVQVLRHVAEVLQATHAWALPHGNLCASSVFLSNGAVKLIDFGLAKQRATIEQDLRALGALGFSLLTAEEFGERGPPPVGPGIPDGLDRFLRELLENRVADATEACRELARISTSAELAGSLSPIQPAVAPPRRFRAGLMFGLAAALVGGGAVALVSLRSPVDDGGLTLNELLTDEPDEPVGPGQTQTKSRPVSPTSGQRRAKAVPSAGALMSEIARLESRLRQQERHGDDDDQALSLLNKQRLRLTGSPTERERQEVARQLEGWRRSYLTK
jgi:serine/threonine protein kinase